MNSNNTPINITLSERLEGVEEYYFSRKLREIAELRKAGRPIISLGIGSPDQPPHPAVVEALYECAQRPDVHVYQPYRGAECLREAFAVWYKKYYGVELNVNTEVLPLIGSKEGLMHLCMTFVRSGEQVLIPNPGYPTYRSAVTLSGGEPLAYTLSPEKGWLPDFDEMESWDLSRVKMMIMNYPQMPTGALPTEEMFHRAVEFATKHNILLIHDNPYSFVRNDKPVSLLSIPGARECAMEMNSLSKSHNMAGWRIGVLCGRKEWVEAVMRFKSNMDSGQFLPMQVAAVAALELDEKWYTDLNALYRGREVVGKGLLDALGCEYESRQAGLFLWAKVPQWFDGDSYAFSDYLVVLCDLFVTPGAIFGEAGRNYIRITLCTPEEVLREATERVKAKLTINR